MAPIGYSGARGKLIWGKNLLSKVSCQTPFKMLKAMKMVYILIPVTGFKGEIVRGDDEGQGKGLKAKKGLRVMKAERG